MPSPGVADGDLDVRVDALQADLHPAAARRELDGVREQVPHDLLQPLRVAGDRHAGLIERRLQPDALGGRRRRHGVDRVWITSARFDRPDVEPQLAGDDPRHVEHVADQLLLQLARYARWSRASTGSRSVAITPPRSICV